MIDEIREKSNYLRDLIAKSISNPISESNKAASGKSWFKSSTNIKTEGAEQDNV